MVTFKTQSLTQSGNLRLSSEGRFEESTNLHNLNNELEAFPLIKDYFIFWIDKVAMNKE